MKSSQKKLHPLQKNFCHLSGKLKAHFLLTCLITIRNKITNPLFEFQNQVINFIKN